MALRLMEPAYNELPFFQANQVLTVEHLNDLAGYLAQQEHYTRNKLIGTGIVCGLSFKWENPVANKAKVTIDDGCAVTSAGYMIVYKQPIQALEYKRNFLRLNLYPPFNDPVAATNLPIYELITLDEYNSERVAQKDFLFDTDKADRVLILLLEPEIRTPAKCLDENCDDKGKVYLYTIRPLLVPIAVMNAIIDANNTKTFFTEEGRAAKGRESILFGLDYIRLANLFKNKNLQIVNAPADLLTFFKAPCLDPDLTAIETQINTLITKFPWIFDAQLNCMKSEVAALAAASLGTLFKNNAQAFRNAAANNNYIQYLYDFLRDVVDAYNELFSAVTDLVGECGGNEFIHPYHVMLGLPLTNDTFLCYKEEKYNEHNFKYHNYFVPSPVMDGQFMLYEKVQSLFKRLVRIIANFKVNISDTTIKITPGKDYDRLLGDRALPYFYQNADSIKRVWNYDSTRRNKINRIKGYQLAFNQDQLLDEDNSKNDLYRIEGHIGGIAATVQGFINGLRSTYNLPFTITTVSIQSTTNATTCTFPDLEAEYKYYRDRALGYIREVLRFLDSIQNTIAKVPAIKPFYDGIVVAILKMKERLSGTECTENFNYLEYKKDYTRVWEIVFEAYYMGQSQNVKNAKQTLNSVINVFNIIFFRPIYKIWYMYRYRIAVLAQSQLTSLSLLATKTTGLEHLAGVRRGETFLLVSDTTQGDKVIADFNLPDLLGCSCDCKPDACDGTKLSLVSPLQKPIIMVVDYSYKVEKAYSKPKAFFDSAHNQYVLELDGMGFYKGDSTIGHNVVVKNAKDGTVFQPINAVWENEKLILRYTHSDSPENDGAFKLLYELTGDFDGSIVTGDLFLFVTGRVIPGGATHTTAAVGGRVRGIYPYDKKAMRKVRPDMKFAGATKLRTIGDEKVEVFTTANGNEMGIYQDQSGFSYIKVIKAKNPGVEEVPFVLSSGGASSKGTVNINVVDKTDALKTDTVTGRVLTSEGVPVKDVKVSVPGGKEVITDEKGEYTLTGLKAGDVITVEKGGYKTTSLQANSKLDPEVKLEKESLINLPGLENLNLPGGIGNFTEGINTLRNFMK